MAHERYDMAVVGAGVVGLAHALAATRLGLRTVVVDREAKAIGASVRNFGFVTVTGQQAGRVWHRARRSRDVWAEVAGPAGVQIVQRGLVLAARRPEAQVVAEAFLRTDMAEGCGWLDGPQARARLGAPASVELTGALTSEGELRVDSRTAIPALARWLETAQGVTFLRPVAVRGVAPGRVDTTAGVLAADHVVVCPGDDLATLFPEVLARASVTRCQLQMLRLGSPGRRLDACVMSDLGIARYLGWRALPQAEALLARLRAEQGEHLAHGVHLIVAQNADGTLVVGDSHAYGDAPPPFASAAVEALILDEFARVLGPPPPVLERWTGTYASAAGHSLVEAPAEGVRLVVVTGGTGASTAFALAEEVVGELTGARPAAFLRAAA